ncbi:hypothetical protein MRY87_09650 [bacterium]|nr:hypothetical protein [bacterium]
MHHVTEQFSETRTDAPCDEWVWGKERLLWGYSPEHHYTLKILQPKRGREGCLSLQYHHEKSETWFVLSGKVWALIIQSDQVFSRVMSKGDFQNLPTGTVHRLMGLTDDAQVLESSTPDRHAADKTIKKDVIRLHCVLGRECEPYEYPEKQPLIETAIQVTEETITALEAGKPLPAGTVSHPAPSGDHDGPRALTGCGTVPFS